MPIPAAVLLWELLLLWFWFELWRCG